MRPILCCRSSHAPPRFGDYTKFPSIPDTPFTSGNFFVTMVSTLRGIRFQLQETAVNPLPRIVFRLTYTAVTLLSAFPVCSQTPADAHCENLPQLTSSTAKYGPFSLGGHKYTVLLLSASITDAGSTDLSPRASESHQTLVRICVQDES